MRPGGDRCGVQRSSYLFDTVRPLEAPLCLPNEHSDLSSVNAPYRDLSRLEMTLRSPKSAETVLSRLVPLDSSDANQRVRIAC